MRVKAKRRVLALHFGGLGDFVLSWPALGLLAAGPPAGELSLIGRPDWGRLILPPERVHDRESGRLAHLFSPRPSPDLDAWLSGFDLAVVFGARPDPDLINHLEAAGPEVWPVATRPPDGVVAQAADWQVRALRERGLNGPAQALPVILEKGSPHGAPVVAPGSGGRPKRLAPALVGRIVDQLERFPGRPVIVLGPAEEAAYRAELAETLAGREVSFAFNPNLPDLARLLAGAALYVGADSGVSHLAATLGAPTLVAFGPSDPRIWAPRGPRVRVAALKDLADLAGLIPEWLAGP